MHLLFPVIVRVLEVPMITLDGPIVDPACDVVWVAPWVDPVVDDLGHDPRSPYVERFWLGVLGPSATWLIRAIAYGFESQPDGFALHLPDTARLLGLGDRTGRSSPFVRAMSRMCAFELAYPRGEALMVRRQLPWLDRRHVARLPEGLQAEHRQWEEHTLDPAAIDAMRRRAQSLALTMAMNGEDEAGIERTLDKWRFHPSLSRPIARWAVEELARRASTTKTVVGMVTA